MLVAATALAALAVLAFVLFPVEAFVLVAQLTGNPDAYKSNGGAFNFLAYEQAPSSREMKTLSIEAAANAQKDINAYFSQNRSVEGLVTELEKSGATCKMPPDLKGPDSLVEEYCLVQYNQSYVCLTEWTILIPKADSANNRDIRVSLNWTCL
jgi:hypothetical protein